ncbi:MAG: hypothetical protein KME52_09780 [Desmonostoc geniculatum HA4340-LM1]|jgi:hypothetical protein|nr:hypothetical protein [Desmonostoc geniculatum HA4340-LM1]
MLSLTTHPRFKFLKVSLRVTKAAFRVAKAAFHVTKAAFHVTKAAFRVTKAAFRVAKANILGDYKSRSDKLSLWRRNTIRLRFFDQNSRSYLNRTVLRTDGLEEFATRVGSFFLYSHEFHSPGLLPQNEKPGNID